MNCITCRNTSIYPSKIVCVGRNYVEHIAELNNEIPTRPVIFIKPNSALSSGLYCGEDEPVHYEGELTFLIHSGKIAAVGFGLDLTKRELQSSLKERGLPWERAKAFDRSAVFSSFVSVPEDLRALTMELHINGTPAQYGTYSLMMNKPDALLAEVSSFLTMEDGDLLMTGTPKGVGIITPGDNFVGRVFHNGELLIEQQWVAEKS